MNAEFIISYHKWNGLYGSGNTLILHLQKSIERFHLLQMGYWQLDNQGIVHNVFMLKVSIMNSGSYCKILKGLGKATNDQCPGKLMKGTLLLHDNAMYSACITKELKKFERKEWEHHPTLSWHWAMWKRALQRYDITDEDIQNAAWGWLLDLDRNFQP